MGERSLTGQGKEVKGAVSTDSEMPSKEKHRTRQHHIHSAGNTDKTEYES